MLGSEELVFEREVIRVLQRESEEASLLVVGDPGMGKSVALEKVATAWTVGGHDVVVIAADGVPADSLGQLRDEIGLTHDVLEVLENWPGSNVGLLVIDALDAARSDRSAKTFRDLIAGANRLKDRWRIAASVRSFDLQYGEELKRLFKASPSPAFSTAEFAAIRHISIPPLSDNELNIIASQSAQLGELLAVADDSLLALLRVPFNLHLAAELIAAGIALPGALSGSDTTAASIIPYWSYRVLAITSCAGR